MGRKRCINVGSFFFFFSPPITGLCRLAPLAPILNYDWLDDPTRVTKEDGAGPLLRYNSGALQEMRRDETRRDQVQRTGTVDAARRARYAGHRLRSAEHSGVR